MTDDALLAELMNAAPTFASAWCLIAEAYPAAEPATLRDGLFYLDSHLRGLVVQDRCGELGPLLAAVERVYGAATPSNGTTCGNASSRCWHQTAARRGSTPSCFSPILAHNAAPCGRRRIARDSA